MIPSPCGESELYCWPCFGIIANIANDANNVNLDGEYCGYWMRKFSEYKPLGIEIFSETEQVVVRFDGDWSGFKNAVEFHKCFEARGRGRDEWIRRRTSPGSRLYGWIAREDDYKSDGPLGRYLNPHGALKTIYELIQDATMDREKVLSNVVNEINSRNENLNQLLSNYSLKRMSVVEMLKGQDKIFRAYDEVTMKLQHIMREHIKGVLEEREMLKFELENKRQCLDSWKKDLNKHEEALDERERRILDVEIIKMELRKREEALIERERRVLEVENIKMELRKREEALIERERRVLEVEIIKMELRKHEEASIELERRVLEVEILENMKNDLINYVLRVTAEERRRKADENAGELIEVQKREKEALNKVHELERKLDEKQPEIEELKEQITGVQILYGDLLVQERVCNDELQGARKELIKGLNGMLIGHRATIGIKRMGEIDPRAFKKTCARRFPPEDAETRALELCSLWQEKLKNPQWHPFRVVENDKGILQRLLNEGDELLRGLKDEWGEDIYDAVVTALKDLHEYNPSGCYHVSEFWNFKEDRKATFKEVISHICSHLKTLKR